MTAPAADLDVIIPFHGRLDLVLECAAALAKNDPIGGRVFLVDDGSPSRRGDPPARAFDLLRLPIRRISTTRRRGFVHAVNAAWAECTRPAALVLNSDAVVPPELIHHVRNALARDARLGAVAPASDNPTDLFQFQAGAPGRTRAGAGADTIEVPYLTAMCLAVRRDAVGGRELFDPIFSPGYFEDLDLCCRLRAGGWRLGVLEGCRAHHIGRATFAGDPELAAHLERNYATFAARWRHLESHPELEHLLWSREVKSS